MARSPAFGAITGCAVTGPRPIGACAIAGTITRAGAVLSSVEHFLAVAAAIVHPICSAGPQVVVAEFLRNAGVVVSDPLAVRRIVLPVVSDVGRSVVVIDVEVAVTPVEAAAPVIAPASDRPAGAECQPCGNHAGTDVGWIAEIIRRIFRIGPVTINCRRIVVGNVDRIGLRLLDDDHLLVLLLLNADLLLLVGDELVARLRLCAQPLYRIHHVGLLRQHGIAEILGPVDLVAHHRENIGCTGQRLDAVVPCLLVDRCLERIAFQILVGFHPAVGLHGLQGIGRSRQHIGEQLIGVKRDRRDQRIELLGFQQGLLRLRRFAIGRLRRRNAGNSDHDG